MNEQRVKVEVCIDSLESLKAALQAKCDRVEICASLENGGTTPSLGMVLACTNMIKNARETFVIKEKPDPPYDYCQCMILIRCRGGDFYYSSKEKQIMLLDIENFCNIEGVDGFAFGALNKEGAVDLEFVRSVAEICISRSKKLTFHRAIDSSTDFMQSIGLLTSVCAEKSCALTILTSGGQVSCANSEAISMYQKIQDYINQQQTFPNLSNKENPGIAIMPGAGLKSLADVQTLLLAITNSNLTNFKYIHGSFSQKSPRVKDSRTICSVDLVSEIVKLVREL